MKIIKVNRPFNLEIEEVPISNKIKPKEVLIKVKTAGICGSDIHIYHGTSPVVTYPRVIGHEFAGEIIETGSDVLNLKIGDHVVVDPVISCGKCYPCSIGRNNVCVNLKVRGVHIDGGFSEYVTVPEISVHKISKQISWEEAALIEPFTIASQVISRGRLLRDETVLILGAGPIGLSILQIAKKMGANCIVTDIFDYRLKLAKNLGADITINSRKENVLQVILKETNGLGVPLLIEAVGLANLLEDAIKIVAPAGRIVTLGFVDKPSQIFQMEITKKEIDIIGSRLHTNKFPQVIQLFNKKELNPELLISHVYHFEEVKKAFRLIEDNTKEKCKIILKFD